MVQVKQTADKIEITFDEMNENITDLFKELKRVLCFIIIAYKIRFEELQNRKMSEVEEDIINRKIKESVVVVPLDSVRKYVSCNHLQ